MLLFKSLFLLSLECYLYVKMLGSLHDFQRAKLIEEAQSIELQIELYLYIPQPFQKIKHLR